MPTKLCGSSSHPFCKIRIRWLVQSRRQLVPSPPATHQTAAAGRVKEKRCVSKPCSPMTSKARATRSARVTTTTSACTRQVEIKTTEGSGPLRILGFSSRRGASTYGDVNSQYQKDTVAQGDSFLNFILYKLHSDSSDVSASVMVPVTTSQQSSRKGDVVISTSICEATQPFARMQHVRVRLRRFDMIYMPA